MGHLRQKGESGLIEITPGAETVDLEIVLRSSDKGTLVDPAFDLGPPPFLQVYEATRPVFLGEFYLRVSEPGADALMAGAFLALLIQPLSCRVLRHRVIAISRACNCA
jgi:hypothetical protein